MSEEAYRCCRLCPRECGADRSMGPGACGEGDVLRIARASLHKWEEPPVCTGNGSGAVFFGGCPLSCCYCQNYSISQLGTGFDISAEELCDIMLRLRDEGACNINLVSASHFLPTVLTALDRVKSRLGIPVMYNSSGYEKVESLKQLNGYVDIYLPDFKYYSSELSERYSAAGDYFERASQAVAEMFRQTGKPRLDGDSLKSGVIVRHLALPSHRDDSIRVIKYLGETYKPDEIMLSVMRQYTPVYRSCEFAQINRRLTTFEYNSILDEVRKYGFCCYIQEKQAADEGFIPEFYCDKSKCMQKSEK